MMHIQKLYVGNFRNYEEAAVACSPGVNVLYGANAQGKTSLLEAIHILMIGRSFRTTQTRELIRKGSEGFFIEAIFVRDGIEQKLRFAYTGQQRQLFHNSTEYPSLTNLLGLLPGVVISPDDEIVKGPPQSRRQFLDIQIAQIDPQYVHSLSRYQRALRQRNHLLRAQNFTTIESWEQQLASAASYITAKRRQTVAQLQKICHSLHPALSGEEQPFTLSYQAKAAALESVPEIETFYLEQFAKGREREAIVGSTLYGPHRDELTFLIGEQEARSYGSEGQKRTCSTMLRLAAWELLKERLKTPPLMLIDDIGMSLDDSRRQRLWEHLLGLGQVFITSAQPLSGLDRETQKARFFFVEKGKIEGAALPAPV